MEHAKLASKYISMNIFYEQDITFTNWLLQCQACLVVLLDNLIKKEKKIKSKILPMNWALIRLLNFLIIGYQSSKVKTNFKG